MPPLSLAFDITARDQASPVFKRVGDEAERTGKKAEGLGTSAARGMKTATSAVAGFGSSFGAIAGVIAGAGIVRGIGAVISRASDLNETVNKSNVIFGDNAREIDRWARGAARNLGLSRGAALDAAAGFGNMFTQLGFAGDAAAQMSEQVVQMSADLGSFNNLGTDDVAERISAAFRGEYDSLQLLIPNINAARVEQEAMAATGKENAEQLTAQEKAAAVLAIVQRDGARAMGDFARTSGGLANQQKILNAEWEDAQAQLGQLLLGPATGLVSWLSDTLPKVTELGQTVGQVVGPAFGALGDVLGTVVDVGAGAAGIFGSLPGPLQAAVVAMGAMVVLRGPLSSLFSSIRDIGDTVALKLLYARDAVAGFNGVSGAFRGAASAVVSGLQKIGQAIGPELAVAAGVFLVSEFIGGLRSLTEASDDAKAAAEGLAGALTLVDRAADRRTVRGAIEDVDGLVEALDAAGVSSRDAINGLLGQEDAQNRVTHALEVYMATQRTAQTGGEASDVREAVLAYEELATGYGNAAGAARFFGDESEGAASGAAASGNAAAATVPQFDEAAQAIERWKQQLGSVNEAFVDPLASYQQLLSEKEEAEKRSAQATADATASGKDSWEDYVSEVTVSLNAYADRLQGQIDAQENWRTNLVTIAQRGGADVAQILAQMGEDGVTLTAQMADGTDAEFRRMADLLRRDARLGGEGATAELDKAMTVMAEVGRQGAHATAQGVAQQLGLGVAEVRRIAAQYGVELAAGINPILQGLGKAHIAFTTRAGFNAGGGLWAGGYTGDGGKYTPMGVVHGGEFVFTKEQTAKAGKSTLAVWAKMLDGYAGGGFVSTGQVPRPRSTSPYRYPISTPADATMDREYSETVSWVAAQAAARAAAAAAALIGAVPGAPAAAGGNVGLVQSLAAARGWTGSQWDALYQLVMHESGFRNTAQNPTSTAYGMFQFLDSTWAGYGYGKTSDPRIQTLAGFNYIASKYGSPIGAWNFWQGHHWYDQGGWLQPGLTMAYNGTGRPERVSAPGEEMRLISGWIEIRGDGMARIAGRVVREDRYRQGVNARSS